MVHSDDFQIVPYWTTGQVAVKDKKKRKQIWTTSATTPASFEDKFHLANAVVTCLFFAFFEHLLANWTKFTLLTVFPYVKHLHFQFLSI